MFVGGSEVTVGVDVAVKVGGSVDVEEGVLVGSSAVDIAVNSAAIVCWYAVSIIARAAVALCRTSIRRVGMLVSAMPVALARAAACGGRVGVSLGRGFAVGVNVAVGVYVGVTVKVCVCVGELVAVGGKVGVKVGVRVGVGLGPSVAVKVTVKTMTGDAA